ncbi:hypothetical protein M409DRAFT_60328 [Zasmidium cellare ATCC 36951]|uniref:Uncharacterized protein n=1 Tax=Zasmidium cellare ATCC 36951 TaxID=1080233 RepID=A0A6A6BZ50_ZASCE|nr:uncharacterized protein M409DRAFT_60328 [Zasmidium cellare ATCC 36951]KAF2160077.1 hypothetical protein M409DRAFT_60328 [Zasmidium cellare ATCC 36951]
MAVLRLMGFVVYPQRDRITSHLIDISLEPRVPTGHGWTVCTDLNARCSPSANLIPFLKHPMPTPVTTDFLSFQATKMTTLTSPVSDPRSLSTESQPIRMQAPNGPSQGSTQHNPFNPSHPVQRHPAPELIPTSRNPSPSIDTTMSPLQKFRFPIVHTHTPSTDEERHPQPRNRHSIWPMILLGGRDAARWRLGGWEVAWVFFSSKSRVQDVDVDVHVEEVWAEGRPHGGGWVGSWDGDDDGMACGESHTAEVGRVFCSREYRMLMLLIVRWCGSHTTEVGSSEDDHDDKEAWGGSHAAKVAWTFCSPEGRMLTRMLMLMLMRLSRRRRRPGVAVTRRILAILECGGVVKEASTLRERLWIWPRSIVGEVFVERPTPAPAITERLALEDVFLKIDEHLGHYLAVRGIINPDREQNDPTPNATHRRAWGDHQKGSTAPAYRCRAKGRPIRRLNRALSLRTHGRSTESQEWNATPA